jgi:pimeloyl-ACP methyl ester carboxylesterase
MSKMLFLPGAGASSAFWKPVADLLDLDVKRRFFSWPGLGNEPHDPSIRGLNDLVAMVLRELDEPADLIAQSLGGLVAIHATLAAPQKVRRLVLTATSGGVPIDDLGGADWRTAYRRDYPKAAPWIMDVHEDLSPQLALLTAPCLLLWGDADEISPPAVGRRLRELLPDASLRVVHGGGHDLARTHAAQIAPLIAAHLSA